MKKSICLKVVLVMLAVFTIFATKSVFADDFTDLTGTVGGNTAINNTAGNTTTNTTENTPVNNTTVNTSVLTTNNTVNNNTSLPKTGAENITPVVVLAVVFGISAIYAYKRIQYYKNV